MSEVLLIQYGSIWTTLRMSLMSENIYLKRVRLKMS
jgi:hypothetical protein